ncbi:MAG: hypothetical protein SFV51_28560 [Bryobacteraceae bacterium]|nr:hypothetical protein [Bryobacteraceae bacterium]
MHVPKPNADSSLAQLERILASETFRSAERMSRFLRYVVEETIAARSEQLKEYVIGVEVYDKPPTYDPRVDSTVRSEAGKLRARLAQYYESEGVNDPVVISVPKGGYLAEFRHRVVVEMPAPPRPVLARRPTSLRWRIAAGASGLILIAVIVGRNFFGPSPASTAPTNLSRLTWDLGKALSPSLSREGKLVAYASDRAGKDNLDIWLQPVAGGTAIQLTSDAANETEPDLSADGSKLVFQSERDGGGIYVMSSLGGTARLLAKGGRRPRFSPDGASVAYYSGNPQLFNTSVISGKLFVVRLDTGSTRQIAPDFSVAVNPIWTPDGAHVLFQGYPGKDFGTVKLDWWVTPVTGGPPIKTGVREALMKQHLCDDWAAWRPSTWLGRAVIFSAGCGTPSALWRLEMNERTWQPEGPAVQYTLPSGGAATDATASATGAIVFSSIDTNTDIWALPMEADKGIVTGDLTRLTKTAAAEEHPSISLDGRRLVFTSRRGGNPDIWLLDLETGQEQLLASGPVAQNYGEISPGGEAFTYHEVVPDAKNPVGYNHIAWQQPIGGGQARKLCEDCSYMGPGPAGGYLDHGDRGFVLVEAAGARRPYLAHAEFELLGPMPDRSRRWVAFTAKTPADAQQVFLTRFGSPGAASEWISAGAGMMPVWAPNGKYLYFASPRDGRLCLWAQQIDADSGQPRGDAFALAHFHGSSPRLLPGAPVFRWMSVARNKIVFPATESAANIWLLR